MQRLVVVLAAVAFSLAASAQTITPTAPGPWQFTTTGTGTVPPASYIAPGFDTPPLGIGSVHLAVGTNGGASAQARNTAYAGTLVSAIETLHYSTFVDVDGSGGQAPYINLLIDRDSDGTSDDQLFFEPVYQTGSYPGDTVPNQGAVMPGVWQTWDADAGGWWALSAGTFGPPLVTLATYAAANPNARIVNTGAGLGGIRIIAGLGAGAWDNFLGAADNVTIDTAATTPVTYNFEPDPGPVVTVTVPTPDGWALQTVDDSDGTNTATIDITPAPAPAPMGAGALRLAVGADGDDAAQARSTDWNGQLLRDLSWLSYWTYVQQDGSGGQAPYLIVGVDYDNTGTQDDLLFFEPLYQSATYFPSDPQAALAVGTWQQWDARDGGWWSLNGVAGAGAGTNVKPLSAILDVEPDARITSVRIVAGFGAPAWNNFIGFADAFRIAFNSPITTYDFEPVPSIAIGDVTQAEGTGGTTTFSFNLTLSHAVSQTVTVQYTTGDNTATAADPDYTAVAGTATFAANTTTTTINVSVVADAKREDNETFFVNLNTPQFATIADNQAIGTIVNDDAVPTITIADLSRAEDGGPFFFSIQLSNPSEEQISVNYSTTAGTATAGSDFTHVSTTATILPGQNGTTISVPVAADNIHEGDETFFVNLSDPVNATIADGSATGTILNDDSVPVVTIADVSTAEGNAGTTPFNFTVTLSNPSQAGVTVTYTTTPGTATAGTDFTPASGSVTITAPATMGTITVNVIGDTLFEPSETFTVNLTGATNGTVAEGVGVGTIVDDEAQPVITINDVSLNEGNAGTTPFTFTVTLSGQSATPVSINWTTAPGTATPGTDFTEASGTLVIPAGSLTGSITVNAIGDTLFEPNETFFVNLTGATGGTVADNQGVGTIVNDEAQPVITIGDVSLNEGNAGTTPFTFTVTLSGQSATPVSITWQTAPGTATSGTDFTPASGTLVIPAGSLTGTITVNVIGDTPFEANETFFVNLTGATGGAIADNQGQGTILNDDGPVADVSVTKTGPSTARPNTPIVYTITVSNAGPQTASNVVVTDTLPAGTTFLSAVPSQGTCTGGATTTCNLGAIAAGGSATVTLTVRVPNAQEPITNTATVTNTPEADPNQANNTSGPTIVTVAEIAGIPTLSEWGLLALLAALMGLAFLRLR